MSWADLGEARPVVATPSEAETRRFGLSFARATVGESPHAADRLPELTSAVAASDVDLVVVRYPQRLVTWAAALRDTGRDLLLADTLLYWRLRVGSGRRPDVGDPAVELVVGDQGSPDPAAVGGFVADVFRDYDNHYAADPLLDRDAGLAGYQEWAGRAALAGGAVTVTSPDGVLVALATTALAPGHLEIELAGVRPDHQGRGVYATLLAGCEDLAAAHGVADVVISTQTHNVRVQRAWARYGFEPVASFTTLHALRPGLLPAAGPRGDGSAP